MTFTFYLQYFLFTSTVDDLRQEKMEELIQFYYYELSDLLERLDYDKAKIPSLQKFQLQVLKKYFYGESTVNAVVNQILNINKSFSFYVRLDNFCCDDQSR